MYTLVGAALALVLDHAVALHDHDAHLRNTYGPAHGILAMLYRTRRSTAIRFGESGAAADGIPVP
jgi:hypothetical protein